VTPRTARPAARPEIVRAAVLDAVVVVVFVLIGRASHDEGLSPSGVLGTAWPFLVGGLVGWIVARAWRGPSRIVPTGLIVWGTALVVGMVLRALTGEGVVVPFVITTAVILAILLLGWRAIAALVARRRVRSRA
jgi:peptidoglycan/LPS O-acetylase OafA/YrhL